YGGGVAALVADALADGRRLLVALRRPFELAEVAVGDAEGVEHVGPSLLAAELVLHHEGVHQVLVDRLAAVAADDRVLAEEIPGTRMMGGEPHGAEQRRHGAVQAALLAVRLR